MDKTRGYQASIDYLMPIVTHPVMTGEYCRHLRNSIDAMIKFERIQSELERLNAENTKLRVVVDAAREMLEVIELLHPNMNPNEPCVCYEAWVRGKQALAELDGKDINVPSKEGER